MSRFFVPISMTEFEEKVNAAFFGDNGGQFEPYVLKEKLKADLKVDFDFENYEILGYTKLPNGLTFLGISAGGDWEFPVRFIIYWDGKKLRGYVPVMGNPWNTTTKQAFGNNEVADGKNAHKQWPDKFDGSPCSADDFQTDDTLILQDIKFRILPYPAGMKIKTRNFGDVIRAKLAANPKLAKAVKDVSLQAKIEALKFYAPGDESSELFQQTCQLCYKMYGLGETDHAKTLYQWAKEQAEASKEYAKESHQPLDDFLTGYWG